MWTFCETLIADNQNIQTQIPSMTSIEKSLPLTQFGFMNHTHKITHTHTHAHVYTHKSDNLLLDRTFIMKTKWKMFKLQNVLKKRRKKRSNID